MIPARELLLLMNSADCPANVAAIADLIDSGLSAFVIKDGQVVGTRQHRLSRQRAHPRNDIAGNQRITRHNGATPLPP